MGPLGERRRREGTLLVAHTAYTPGRRPILFLHVLFKAALSYPQAGSCFWLLLSKMACKTQGV